MSTRAARHLFDCFGVELEYMIVDAETLDVRPWADRVLRDQQGAVTSDVEAGPVTWSNELVAHVIELKTTQPAPRLSGLAGQFAESVGRIQALLAAHGARLLPTGMHPWMNPAEQTRLWPHDGGDFYASFDRIFDCRGHGWANLQSVHLNLPFADDQEFARLHAAIRLVLPLLPALAASSPLCEGRPTGRLDQRLEVYRHNCDRIPSITGTVIPEPVFTPLDYRRTILEPMYRDITPWDPDQVLQDEWLNARGAIARFQRQTIEIRLLDVQECPAADLAIVALVAATVRMLVAERTATLARQQAWQCAPLAELLQRTIDQADQAPLDDSAFLELFGYAGRRPATAGQVWRHLLDSPQLAPWLDDEFRPCLGQVVNEGPLARRILQAVGLQPSAQRLRQVYGQLAECLSANRMFSPK